MGFLAAGAAALAFAFAAGPSPAAEGSLEPPHSLAVGSPSHGRLVDGVQLPAEGMDYFTWDFPLGRKPDRPWRRWATDRTIVRLVRVLYAFAATHPGAPRVGVGDLSRPHGGPFGRRFGGLGHASHQNGLDADVLYPRLDRLERPAARPAQVDLALSQDLVDLFLRAGAVKIFVGPHLPLRGPRRIVQTLAHHDDHMHVRFAR